MGHNDWEITFVDTGLETQKGGRIKRVERFIESDNFHLTYGDGVANINIKKLLVFHKAHKNIGTLTAVRPPSRFGEIKLVENKVIHFEEKPQLDSGFINGGFFVFNKDFFDYITSISLQGGYIWHCPTHLRSVGWPTSSSDRFTEVPGMGRPYGRRSRASTRPSRDVVQGARRTQSSNMSGT